jgi:hypothetical protein
MIYHCVGIYCLGDIESGSNEQDNKALSIHLSLVFFLINWAQRVTISQNIWAVKELMFKLKRALSECIPLNPRILFSWPWL